MKTDFKKIISHLQIEADNMAYNVMIARNKEARFNLLMSLQEVCNFNAIGTFKYAEFLIRDNCIRFIIKNKDQLKDKLELIHVLNISEMYNITSSIFNNILDFNDLRTKYNKLVKK